jgi:membrane peptidoglycan carboxypeptidase
MPTIPQTPFPAQEQPRRTQALMEQSRQMAQRLSQKMASIRKVIPPIPQRPLAQYLSQRAANARQPNATMNQAEQTALMPQSGAPTNQPNQATNTFQPGVPMNPRSLARLHIPQRPQALNAHPDAAPITQPHPEPWRRSRAQRISRIVRKRRERVRGPVPKRKKVRTILISVFSGLLAALIITLGISSYMYYVSQLPKLQALSNLHVSQSTHFYDRNGNLLYTLYNDKYGRSVPVSYIQIPGFMQDAQIAAEDKTFWTNDGVDPQGILRAAVQNTSSQQIQSGASTITQQVVRNLDHQTEENIQRKISEATLAIGLTNQYPKWKILEMYFNIAPFGDQEQGVEAAAEDFFGLTPQCDKNFKCTPAISFLDRDLSKCKNKADETTCAVDPILGLARASILASIPQNPPMYDPLSNTDHALLYERQDYVLNQMMSDGMKINLSLGAKTDNVEAITPAIIQQVEALTKSKNFQYVGFKSGGQPTGFVQWVISTLAESLGKGNYNTGLSILEDSGLNIRTTLDSNLEKYVQDAIHRHIDEPDYQFFLGYKETLSQTDNLEDSAAVVIDAKTGEVLAMQGTANIQNKAGAPDINMALEPRQPGSSFKPFEVAASYEMGFYPGMILPDHKTYFPTGQPQCKSAKTLNVYCPPDYSGYSNRPTTIVSAISQSLNVPALKMEYYAGMQNVYNMAARLGITSINPVSGLVPSMALGTQPVSLLQMTDAYQTFANQGVHIPPQGVLNIWDNYGHELYQYDPSKAGAQVISQQIAYLVTSTLDNEPDRAPEFGGDHALSFYDWTLPGGGHPDVAAKTGTTDSFVDNWTIGYTPDVVVGVWSGNADYTPMKTTIGVTGAAPIWHSIIEYVSGKCNTNGSAADNYRDADQIPCPALDLSYTDRHFTVPSGIVNQQVNTYNGLAGRGFISPMIDGEQPSQSGGNPPVDPGRPGKRHH